MYHTKSKDDYMSRYPRSGRGLFQTPNNQTSMAHSSSSPETSPDSFPDLSLHQFPQEFRSEETWPDFYKRNYNRDYKTEHQHRYGFTETHRADNLYTTQLRTELAYEPHFAPSDQEMSYGNQPQIPSNFVLAEHICDTPRSSKQQRPIIGRNVMAAEPLKPLNEFSMWQPNMAQTPPKSVEHKYTQSYELFPTENRGFELPSPVKSSSHTSPQLGTPPRFPMTSRTSTPITPPAQSPFSPRMATPFKEPLIGPNTSVNLDSSKLCTFCRKNGETPLVYMTHSVKERVGNKNVVTCPILRSHVCSKCGASGDNAHTITYCPVLRSSNHGQPLQSTTITLKNTRVKSNVFHCVFLEAATTQGDAAATDVAIASLEEDGPVQ